MTYATSYDAHGLTGMADARHLFAPDPTDSHVAQALCRPATWRPAHRLVAAVLERAIADLRTPGDGAATRELRAEARRWITSTCVRGPFAFVRVCEALGLEPTRVRESALADVPPERWQPRAVRTARRSERMAAFIAAQTEPFRLRDLAAAAGLDTGREIGGAVMRQLLDRGAIVALGRGWYRRGEAAAETAA